MVKRTSTIEKKFKPNQAALDAWHKARPGRGCARRLWSGAVGVLAVA